ncbi:MAG TPA: UDP-N-acetylglucosamine 1-carboxyvinyltransferase, partial [Clostridia bacterium]|nr:UDP-N-acetylglucosamine 1-carboxyvinyltransferase [Clostridia bacterium]
MDKLSITGGKRLTGRVTVSGAKNAVLPIIAASLLAESQCSVLEAPRLADVHTIIQLIEELGAKAHWQDTNSLLIDTRSLVEVEPPQEYVRKMRASFLVMGPLLARKGRARMWMPGGCAIGSRPIDLHLKGFAALGADVRVGHGVVEAKADRLTGARVYLDFPSVGATENIMMAATLAEGTTIIENAAEEPEIVALATFLNSLGARVTGAGTNIIRIEGVK